MKTMDELKQGLTEQQLLAAQLLINNEFAGKERRTQDTIAEEIGISRVQLWNWRKKDVKFIEYMNALADVTLDSYRATADAQLIKLIEGTSNNGLPSIKGLELYYKLSGRLVSRQEIVNLSEAPPKRATKQEIADELARLEELLN
ncbi:phBC6A51 family helix-turn-helix protein [Fictibacillus enclensis]|uniref:phBC6A51 family helix-turn-helix protein n=1 Tax=Fictibacillus enclensis TaxID=1017270 RepID=UPI0024BF4A58|nr:phBC6A51 family helix-turn-helix protein [Fictibacillus enclensis]WHY73452.1 phBC6A51 family helix-turn-helix protein [Fictibacillus enclensis]